MIWVRDILVSLDLINTFFCCDLSSCKGLCCVEGDAGPPLGEGEAAVLNANLSLVWDDLSESAREVIRQRGICEQDPEGEYVIPTIGKADCVFTCYDSHGVCRCALEAVARRKGQGFLKPVSCHLFPAMVVHYTRFTALNVQKRQLCREAFRFGKREGILLYRFLAEPLTRRFGQAWYDELCLIAREWFKDMSPAQ
ncbi:MAG: DUF3109 family protein [Tannerellaceae bacterium]|nr:DUF3109 family protein [Tannerellaceae bacterium]